jgi:hypothetical protein
MREEMLGQRAGLLICTGDLVPYSWENVIYESPHHAQSLARLETTWSPEYIQVNVPKVRC